MQELLEYSNVDLLKKCAHTATVMRLYHLRNNDSMSCLNEAIEISMRT